MVIGLGHLEATRLGTTLVAAFLASLVECVEALTVVLAVGSVRGWRSALAGAAAALACSLPSSRCLARRSRGFRCMGSREFHFTWFNSSLAR